MIQFIRFCLVGAFATAVDAGLFYILRQWVPYQLSMIISYSLSLCVNIVLTLLWTFGICMNIRNALKIAVVHLFNLFVVRFGLMALFVTGMNINDKVAFLPTLFISVITNFVIIKAVIHGFKHSNYE